ncbi:MAG: TROVE domain-containing protein, partial [Armatimonadetes bacterium]|nr:TROVE domain-containing protein [Armatimonadota bacterium]
SRSGRAIKNDAAIFALAVASAMGNEDTRAAALLAVPEVCRTGTHLFQFVAESENLRGWGRGMRKAVGQWYKGTSVENLTYQAIKYQQRNGWSHRDLLRLAHPKPESEEQKGLFKWMVSGEGAELNPRLEAFEKLKATNDSEVAARLITEFRLPREAVPTELLTKPEVWEALLADMPMTAMIRNLGVMSKIGLVAHGSESAKAIVEQLRDQARIRKARVHPLAVLTAMATYRTGKGLRGSRSWTPVESVVQALEEAFYLAFENVEPTGKRFLLGIDVSSSMSWSFGAGNLTCAQAATAMALVALNRESDVRTMAFAESFRQIPLRKGMRMDEALRYTTGQTFGATDCAVPMIWARANNVKVDVFVVYTDNETWFGPVDPVTALRQYRDKTGLDSKLIVVGMTSTQFSIADPGDPGMLNVVGFDASVPSAMREFVA